MNTIIIVTIFLASVIGFGLVLKHLRKKGFKTSQPPATQAPPKPQVSPEEEFIKILETLLGVNLMIRKDRYFPHTLVIQTEEIIDDLKSVIPPMMENYPGETLTYEIKKIGNTHLHKIIKEFLDLSPESRDNQSATFEETLKNLHQVCRRSRQIVEMNETAEFKTMAHFLESKFS